MNKTDSTDLTNRIKSLLEIMTNNCSEDKNSEDEEYSISSDEMSSENDDNDDIQSDLSETGDFSNEDYHSTVFRLNKFFRDHVENTEKHLPSTLNNNEPNNIQFEEKMYRVIPLKLDEKVLKSKIPFVLNKNKNQRK
ncbi:uncharacterized protein LOC117604801 [Osmia lignaria lignaria]|uniref:uncharacterized protein LOC117604801 n=1 Tax=Osmia lignaria lignaria TaxID=1437193 RepID=UPI001479569D|nr:uncharacterized protein LOC117604801 [Osmia lignaria]